MSGRFAKYSASVLLGLRGALEYRANFAFSLLGAVAPVIIQTALWTCLYAPDAAAGAGAASALASAGPSGAAAAGATLFGFTYAQMLGYVVVANIVSRLVRTGFEYDLNDDIKSGGLDRFLVKPIGYFGFRLAQFIGAKSAETVFMGLALLAALVVLGAVTGFSAGVFAILGFLAALVLAFALNFLLFWCVGLLGFWLSEIGFLFEAARIVIVTASGGIFPLSVFGPRAEAILDAMPFRYTIQFPTDVLCGRVTGSGIAIGIAEAAAWCAVLLLAARTGWAAGIKRFVALGS